MKVLKTHNFSVIQSACEDAQRNGKIIAIIGKKGFGMTTGFRFYHENGPVTGVLYVDLLTSITTKEILCQLTRQICPGEKDIAQNEYHLIELIKYQIRCKERPCLLIFDNFSFKTPLIGVIDELYNMSISHTMGVIIGTDQRTINLVRRNASKPGWIKFARNLKWGGYRLLQKPMRDEISAIASAHGVGCINTINKLVLQCPDYNSLTHQIENFKEQQIEC